MLKQQYRLNWLQSLIERIASRRAAAWLLSLTSHRIDAPLMRLLNGRISLGRLFTGPPIMVITTVGANTKQKRTLPVVGILDGEKIVLIGVTWRRKNYPGWHHNLKASPGVAVSVSGLQCFWRGRPKG